MQRVYIYEYDNCSTKKYIRDRDITGDCSSDKVIFVLVKENENPKRDKKGKIASNKINAHQPDAMIPIAEINSPPKMVYISGKISGLSKDEYTKNF